MRPLRTVYALLAERGALALLDDPGMEVATAEIRAGRGEPRYEVQRRIKVGGWVGGRCGGSWWGGWRRGYGQRVGDW